jgi:hypothetical protein
MSGLQVTVLEQTPAADFETRKTSSEASECIVMDESEKWREIDFPPEIDWPYIHSQLMATRLMKPFEDAGEPPGFGVFSGGSPHGRARMYLTPVAAHHCGMFVERFKGVPVDKADIPSSPPPTWIAGDADCKEWFQ